jgi:hypothetical protein
MKMYEGVAWVQAFLTSALDREVCGQIQAHPEEKTFGTYWTGGWLDP